MVIRTVGRLEGHSSHDVTALPWTQIECIDFSYPTLTMEYLMAAELSPLFSIISDSEASPRAAAVFEDIRQTRKTDFINNFWRVLANDPDNLEQTWAELKHVMAPGAIDSMTKDLIYVAVSVANNCTYCIRSHTASARAKGATDEHLKELHAVIAAASRTNRLAIGLQVPVDEAFV